MAGNGCATSDRAPRPLDCEHLYCRGDAFRHHLRSEC